MDIQRKLEILTDAAKYDVACTSSGVDRDAKLGHLGSTTCAGICHSFAADGRCITLLKVLMTNVCTYDCAYCANRSSNDIPRAAFTPRELADLTIAFYRRNYIEGLFVSSGVLRDADYTMERMCETVEILRNEYGFMGYIHAKAIPGASQELIDKLGFLVDRMSINIELPSEKSLSLLAPDKSKHSVTRPMRMIAQGIEQNRHDRMLPGNRRRGGGETQLAKRSSQNAAGELARCSEGPWKKNRFAPAGQSTQLIVGATPETDFHILRLSSALYRSFDLKRVFFSAYLPINETPLLPDKTVEVPLNREHRLYQADWLMRFYGFEVDEIIDEAHPFLDCLVDPKANWALNHLDLFPVEINTASYEMLLRIPGLGVTGAKRIEQARRGMTLRAESLTGMGLSLKRMQYFITCNGRYVSALPFDRGVIHRQLAQVGHTGGKHRRSGGKEQMEGQLSLFDSPVLAGFGSVNNGTPEFGAVTPDGSSQMPPLQLGQLRAFEEQKRRLDALDLALGLSAAKERSAMQARERVLVAR